MKRISILLVFLTFSHGAFAQELVWFPREDFGKVVLSKKQLAGGGVNFEAAFGNYNNELVSNYGPNSLFAKLGRPVGRLDTLTDKGWTSCTGFLISPKHLITNHHCLPGLLDMPAVKATGAKRIEAAAIVLGYIQEGVEDNTSRFTVSIIPVEANKDLDYAILEVFGRPSAKFGTLKIATAQPEAKSPFWIIGHPFGDAQRISREQCMSASPAISAGRLRHRCDTMPGNSGSPVIDPARGAAIALHHAGSRRNSINFAVPFSKIVESSNLLKKLATNTGSSKEAAELAALRKQMAALREELKAKEKAKPPQLDTAPKAKPRPSKESDKVAIGVFPDKTKPAPRRKSFEPEMVRIPGGTFQMGCVSGKSCDDDEKPVHRVTIKAFEIGKYEVTFDEWDACVAAGGCNGYKPNDEGWGRGKRPVINVSWKDAQAYVTWLSKETGKDYRLPTEADWEYAARAGSTTPFWWGSRIDPTQANYNGNYTFGGGSKGENRNKTVAVDRFKPNAFGLYNVHGNVWEWVKDCWHNNYHGASKGGSAWPGGDCSVHVLRGGSWNFEPQFLRSANRVTYNDRNYNNGFRISRTLTP